MKKDNEKWIKYEIKTFTHEYKVEQISKIKITDIKLIDLNKNTMTSLYDKK